MVNGGRVEVSMFFDNVYEAGEWFEKEYRGFRKDAVLVFKFNDPKDLVRASEYFQYSFCSGDKLFVSMGVIDEKQFLDEAEDLVSKVREFGGVIVEARVTAVKEATNMKEVDELFNEVRREIELQQFARMFDSMAKGRV